jgi:serine/threonine-protein kinase SRK2
MSDMAGHPNGNPMPLTGHPRYQWLEDLSRGTFGFVQLAYDRVTRQQVAIKFIERGDKVTKYVQREILNHRRLLHPHIVEMREVFLTPDYLGIAMEYASGGDLFSLVGLSKGLSEADARWYFQQLIVSVDYCHRMGVANRDIKLENALLDANPRPLLKICDFGYSKHENFQSAPGSRVGTPAYLAPEVILTTKGKTYNAKAADVWSCGVLLYIMLAGAYPFSRPEDETLPAPQRMHVMLQRILRLEYELPPNVAASPEARSLLAGMLVARPEARISITQIQRHPFFLRDLPPGVAEMNDRLVPPGAPSIKSFCMPEGVQSLEETERLVTEAQGLPPPFPPLSTLPDAHLGDGIIDGIMEEDLLLTALINDEGGFP